jgi:hypothetical protein
VLIAVDDALKFVSQNRLFSSRVATMGDRKFREAINLLVAFEKDFHFKDSSSDPNIGGTVTREAKMSDISPSTILSALKVNLHAKVNLNLFLDLSTLTNLSQWAMNGRSKQG